MVIEKNVKNEISGNENQTHLKRTKIQPLVMEIKAMKAKWKRGRGKNYNNNGNRENVKRMKEAERKTKHTQREPKSNH